jgi:hypothetical protein
MAVDNASITVATSPTKLCEADVGAYIANTDAAAIFVGGPRVATSGANKGVSVAATSGTLQLRFKGTLLGAVARKGDDLAGDQAGGRGEVVQPREPAAASLGGVDDDGEHGDAAAQLPGRITVGRVVPVIPQMPRRLVAPDAPAERRARMVRWWSGWPSLRACSPA